MNSLYKKIILGGLSIAIVAGSWFLIIKPNNEETKSIQSQTKTLKTTLADLQEKEAHRAEYLQGIEDFNQMFEDKLSEFPSNLNQEYQIEFVQAVRENPDINYNVTSQGMNLPTAFYVLGGSSAETSTDAEGEEPSSEASGYECYSSTMSFSYTGDYDGVKDFVKYVASYPYRMTIDNVSVAANDEGTLYTGAMTVNIYCITGNGREENMQLELDDVETGVDNLFIGGNSGDVSKFAADNGESIINDYDAILLLNPTTSDTSGKAFALNGGNKITSNKNSVEAVTISVSQVDGKYVMEYSIGAEKQTQEFDPGEDLTVLIQSSDIKDDTDLNGVNVSLQNTTDKTLYVKIADDTEARRVKIVNRSGSIGVFK